MLAFSWGSDVEVTSEYISLSVSSSFLESFPRSAPFDRSGLCSREREEERGEAVWHTVVLLGHTACVAHSSTSGTKYYVAHITACRTQYLCQTVLKAHGACRTPQNCMAHNSTVWNSTTVLEAHSALASVAHSACHPLQTALSRSHKGWTPLSSLTTFVDWRILMKNWETIESYMKLFFSNSPTSDLPFHLEILKYANLELAL